jgi:hypothetical protein
MISGHVTGQEVQEIIFLFQKVITRKSKEMEINNLYRIAP